MTTSWDLIVIGGGAAGFFAALTAAESRPGLQVLILERGQRPLAKVLISGGGRCNVTHACYDPRDLVTYYPRGARELRGAFTRFQPADTIAWFEQRGVPLKTEPDGRVFPVTDRAQTIADCLTQEAARLGVEVRTRCPVQSFVPLPDGFLVQGSGFPELQARRLLLAPGGSAAALLASASKSGHTIVPPVPSLFTFALSDARLAGLSGVSVGDSRLLLTVGGRSFQAAGPLLITHWGLSGPAVLRLSAWAARELAESGYRADLQVGWLGGRTPESLFEALLAWKDAHPRAGVLSRRPFEGLPARLWERLAAHSGVSAVGTWAEVPNRALRRLADELGKGRFTVEGKGSFKEEFVTCGGIALADVDFRTMESRRLPGLYIAGEILDIDGLTGGFNFQSAWTTGYIAGMAIAGKS